MFAPKSFPGGSAAQPEAGAGHDERLEFPGWSAQAGHANPRWEPFHISEIVVLPDDSYCFDVKRGGMTVVRFSFDAMSEAASGAQNLKPLLAVLQRLRQPG